jgi:non-ribosomal peptide synthetase component F
VANRTQRETEDLIGFFLNLLVLRTDLSGLPSFRELLARVRRVALNAYAHQDLPFDLLVDALNPRREIPDQPLFQVKIDMQNKPSTPAPATSLPDVSLKGFDVEPGFTHNDLALHISEPGDRLELNLLYSLDLFDAPRMRGMLEDYRTVLSAVIADPEATLASLDENLDVSRRERELGRRREFKDSVRSRLRKVQRKPDPAESGKEDRA